MNEYDVELLGFYRTRLAECIQIMEALARHAPIEHQGATYDHIAKLKSIIAHAERAREAQS